MFRELKQAIAQGRGGVVVYYDSDYVLGDLRDNLRILVGRNVLEPASIKEYKQVFSLCAMSPLDGGKWLVLVGDSVSASLTEKNLGGFPSTAFFVYFTKSFKKYKEFGAKMLGIYAKRYDIEDIRSLFSDRDDIVQWAHKDYAFDIDALYTLKQRLNTGAKVKSKADIIRLVGLGGVTISSLLYCLLDGMADEKIKYVDTAVQYYETLRRDYTVSQIYNFMLRELSSLLLVKNYMIQGHIVGGRAYGFSEDSEDYAEIMRFKKKWADVDKRYSSAILYRLYVLMRVFAPKADETGGYELSFMRLFAVLGGEARSRSKKFGGSGAKTTWSGRRRG